MTFSPASPEAPGSDDPGRPGAGTTPPRPNETFRRLRGGLSPGEFAAAVRRAAREIGERVACDARYVGRVESGEIRCPNYAYERVFRHMYPELDLTGLGFEPRDAVRGRAGPRGAVPRTGEPTAPAPSARTPRAPGGHPAPPCPDPAVHLAGPGTGPPAPEPRPDHHRTEPEPEESDVLRRAFMTGGPATLAALTQRGDSTPAAASTVRVGETEAGALEDTVRRIRLLDDRHGADHLYRRAGRSLAAAHLLLDTGSARRRISDRIHSGAGELALSVGWLAHDSGRWDEARSHYAEALATARMNGDVALEAHAFCNSAFLARDTGRPRESVRAAQAGQQAAHRHSSHRLRSLLTVREAGGWAGLGDRAACEEALGRARDHFERGTHPDDPEWMSFYGEAELAGLEAQCWSALGDFSRAAESARLAVELQEPHFVRNTALFSAELAGDLAGCDRPAEAAATGLRSLELLAQVRSSRITTMLRQTARRLVPYRREPEVGAFLGRVDAAR
ncbi:hypothetical protein [Streptomyces lonarensis]|uniref:hypothetical protein n=1 Tax=Streptomyces lonarensis TaxID=700599 RepID=UPI001FD80B7B|nr:hypothetical protein [Streptomyces lonarensis]